MKYILNGTLRSYTRCKRHTANNIRTVKAYGNYYNNPASFAVLNKMVNWHFLNNISCRIRPYNNDRPCLRINNIDFIVMYSNRIYSHKIKDYMIYDTLMYSTHLLYMYLFLEMCHRFFLCHQSIISSSSSSTSSSLSCKQNHRQAAWTQCGRAFFVVRKCAQQVSANLFMCIYMFWYGVFTLKRAMINLRVAN